MEPRTSLAVDSAEALHFFFERLRDVLDTQAPALEVWYNASVLAHFAITSTASSVQFPASPSSLTTVFDLHVLDRSESASSDVCEAAGSQCLLLTGLFAQQQARRHNILWYAHLGAAFYARAAHAESDPRRRVMMQAMAEHFEFWRRQHARLGSRFWTGAAR